MEAEPGMDALGLVALALIIVAFGTILLLTAGRGSARLRKGAAALAARRGWQAALVEETSGKARKLRLSGPGWRAETRRYVQGETGTSVFATEFEAPGVPWPGHVVIGPTLDGAEAALAARLTGGAAAMSLLTAGEMGPLVPRPEATGFGGTVFSSSESVPLPDATRLHPLLAAWRRDHPAERQFPIVILGPGGLRLRLRSDLWSVGEMERFADLGLSLAEVLETAG